jgi:hypothetical protein
MRKEMYVLPRDVEVGDTIGGFGEVLTNGVENDDKTYFLYLDEHTGKVYSEDWPSNFNLFIEREVPRPRELTLQSLYDHPVLVEDADDDYVQLTLDVPYGCMYKAEELIAAIKAVKGLD